MTSRRPAELQNALIGLNLAANAFVAEFMSLSPDERETEMTRINFEDYPIAALLRDRIERAKRSEPRPGRTANK